jgi:uncharacterized membrane protein YkgB
MTGSAQRFRVMTPRLAIFNSDCDYRLTRASIVFIAFFFGYQKWFPYEANALVP